MILWEHLKNRMQLNMQQKICENNVSMTYEELIIFAEEFAKRLKGIKCCAILCQSEMAASMAVRIRFLRYFCFLLIKNPPCH